MMTSLPATVTFSDTTPAENTPREVLLPSALIWKAWNEDVVKP